MAISIKGTYHFVVFELIPVSGIIFLTDKPTPSAQNMKMLFSAPFDETDDDTQEFSFNACQVWIEQNDNGTSQYTILEMFFYDRQKKLSIA